MGINHNLWYLCVTSNWICYIPFTNNILYAPVGVPGAAPEDGSNQTNFRKCLWLFTWLKILIFKLQRIKATSSKTGFM